MKSRPITPHKGGRTVKLSSDATPEIHAMLKELHEHGVSLGDLIEQVVKEEYRKMIVDTVEWGTR